MDEVISTEDCKTGIDYSSNRNIGEDVEVLWVMVSPGMVTFSFQLV